MRFFFTAMCAGLLVSGFLISGSAEAVDRYVPKGNLYSPDDQRLPSLNSRKDRLNSQTDIYEAEIYSIQKERAIRDGELRRLLDHDLNGGTNFFPRY